MKNVVERLQEEINKTSDDLPVVTVSRKDLQLLIDLYKNLLEKVDIERM